MTQPPLNVVRVDFRETAGSQPVVISNGFSRFHLSVAAEELARRGAHVVLLTGAYPHDGIGRLAVLRGRRKLARLLDRRVDLPGGRVHSNAAAEAMSQLANVARWGSATRLAEGLDAFAMDAYSHRACALASRSAGGVYHFRSGFGGGSISRAKEFGAVALCDHSIAHPETLAYLIANRGQSPPSNWTTPTLSPVWKRVARDLAEADHVLVNSEFVKRTFLSRGWDSERVSVAYWGIDDRFLSAIPAKVDARHGPLRFAFAGRFSRRKGGPELSAAFADLDGDWTLHLLGGIDADARREGKRLMRDQRVKCHPTVPRSELARILAATDVFVFPSLAEGSARVVFEALAAGCYVITTPNAGSVVEDGLHGALVPPGDSESLRGALVSALEREDVREIGHANAAFVRSNFTQRDYGDQLERIYEELRL